MQTHRRARRAPLLVLPWTILCMLASASVPTRAQDIMPEPALPSAEELRSRPAALITGSTSGLGREVARALGGRGWHVIVHGRDHARGLEVVAEVTAAGGTAAFYQADLASVEEVGRLAEAVARDHARLDALVNNAGIWLTGDDERRLSADGYELSFAVNYLAGFHLTRALLPLLRRSAPSRIVNVASVAQTPIDFDDVMLEHGYSGSRAYGQSKLAQIMHALDLAAELEGTGVRVNALHPATLMDTRMVRGAGVRPRATVEEGRDAVLHLLLSPDVGSGGYFDGTDAARADPQAYDEAARARLRALSEELTGGRR